MRDGITALSNISGISKDEYIYMGTYKQNKPRPEYLTSIQLLFMGGIIHERSEDKKTGEPMNYHVGKSDRCSVELEWTIRWR